LTEEEKRGKSIELSNLLLKMMKKMLVALKKKIANTAAIVVAVVAMLMRVLSMKKVLRRLISPAEIAEQLAL
jgi:hypothetical protein